MKQKYFTILFLILFVCLNFCAEATAAELKIFDSLGLIRATSKIKQTAGVEIKLTSKAANLPPAISLTNMDGLSADKEIKHQSGDLYTAHEVSAGTWKIILPDDSCTVQEVKITE